MIRIVVLVLTLAIVGSLLWASLSYFRLASAPDSRKSWYKASIYTCIALHVLAIATSPTPPGWSVAVALGAAVLSLTLFWTAVAAHESDRPAYAFVKEAPTTLVRRGPYRWVRHPFYLSFLLAALAGTFVSGRALLVLTVPWLAGFYRVAAREEEERYLEGELGAEYEEYRATTGMFVPRLRRPTSGSAGRR